MTVAAREITSQQADALRAAGLPAGAEIVEVVDVPWAGHSFRPTRSGLLVPSIDPICEVIAAAEAAKRPKPVAMELFTGAGGFSLGIHQAGFDVVAGVEWEPAAAYTYLKNLGHPDCAVFVDDDRKVKWEKLTSKGGTDWGCHYARSSGWTDQGTRAYFVGDVRRITGPQLLAAAGVERIDLLFGGPPCQGLSTANPKASLEDPRNGLLWEFLRLVEELRPAAFMIENVPPLFTAGKGALIEALAAKAVNAGYDVRGQLVDAASYGVPQFRRRAIVVGDRIGGYRFPMPTHWSKGWTRDGQRWFMREPYDHASVHQDRVQATYDKATGARSMEVEEPASAPTAPDLGPLFASTMETI